MRPALSILIYHRVLAEPDPLLPDLPDIGQFYRQMALLKRCFRVMPLAAAARKLRQGTLPPRAACVTFDDGYADNAQHALPVLRHLGLTATFFVASAYLNGGRMWNDDVIAAIREAPAGPLDLGAARCGVLDCSTPALRLRALSTALATLKYLPWRERQALCRLIAPPPREDLMMNDAQVKSLLAAGMEIGAHTHAHPILARSPDDEALADIARGKAALEALTGVPVTLFAYPNGRPGPDYDQRHVDMVRRLGFAAAVSTVRGAARGGDDLLQLPRYTPWERDRPRFLLKLLRNMLG